MVLCARNGREGDSERDTMASAALTRSEVTEVLEDAGIVLQKALNEIKQSATSVVKTVVDCTKNLDKFIVELSRLLGRKDHDSRALVTRLDNSVKRLKSYARIVFDSCKELAVAASLDEDHIHRIGEELRRRGLLSRALTYIWYKLSFRKPENKSELREFLDVVHTRILECASAIDAFYAQHRVLISDIRHAIDVKRSEWASLKRKEETSRAVNEMSKKVAVGSLVSGIACLTVGVGASLVTGGAAAPIVTALARMGGVVSGVTFASGVATSVVSDLVLHDLLRQRQYLDGILKEILEIHKEVNAVKSSVHRMDSCVQNTVDVVQELSSSQDSDDVEDIKASLVDLHDCMEDLIQTIESFELSV